MRRLMIPALSALVLMSCEQASDTYKLEGEALGYADDTKILVYTFENYQSKIIDTLIVQNEKYSSNYLKQHEQSLKSTAGSREPTSYATRKCWKNYRTTKRSNESSERTKNVATKFY